MTTAIQWTNETWNPVTGCSKVSQGCKNCYAERLFPRVYGKFRQFTDVQCHEDRLDLPRKWKGARMVFVNSMSDLFHEKVPETFIGHVFATMAQCPQHTFQILTKRAEEMADMLRRAERAWGPFDIWPLPNVWLGVSCENQDAADRRIPALLNTPAAMRFVSAEPLLGPIKFMEDGPEISFSWLRGCKFCDPPIPKLDWVIVGGESGPSTSIRSTDLRWVYDIIAQCKHHQVPVFVKQLGRRPVFSGGNELAAKTDLRWRDSHGANLEEWPTDLQIREFPVPVTEKMLA